MYKWIDLVRWALRTSNENFSTAKDMASESSELNTKGVVLSKAKMK